MLKRVAPWLLLPWWLATACSPAPPPVSIPAVSADPVLQGAYGRCVIVMRADMLDDNPELSADLLPAMMNGVYQSCESAVIRTCERGLDTASCRLMLDLYSEA
jgi:hypothetical protein